MSGRIAVVALWAADPLAAAVFYHRTLGLNPGPHHRDRPTFDLGGAHLVILKGKPLPAWDTEAERFPLFAIAVDDLEARMKRLVQAGVDLPWGLERDEGARWVIFRDPAGNLVELVQFGE